MIDAYSNTFASTLAEALEQRDEGAPNLSATETVNVEVESKVEQFEVVCDRSKYLEAEVMVQLDGEQN